LPRLRDCDVRPPGAQNRDGRDRKGDPTGGAELHVRPGEPMDPGGADVPERAFGTVRREHHELRRLRADSPADLPQAEPDVTRVRGELQRAGHVDHATTSSAAAVASGFAGAFGFGGRAGGLCPRFTAPVPRVTGCPPEAFSAAP